MHTAHAPDERSLRNLRGITDAQVRGLTRFATAPLATLVHVIEGSANRQLQFVRVPDGEPQTRATLRIMRALALEGARDPVVKRLAQQVVGEAGVAPHSLAALRVLYDWVRTQIRYRRDPLHIADEYVSSPRRTLETREEDCDGKATLLVAMLRALGHPARLFFRVISTDRARPRRFVHVYAVAGIGAQRIPLDCTYAHLRFGWEYPRAVLREDFAL